MAKLFSSEDYVKRMRARGSWICLICREGLNDDGRCIHPECGTAMQELICKRERELGLKRLPRHVK